MALGIESKTASLFNVDDVFQQILKSQQLGLIHVDENLIIQYMNNLCAKILGITSAIPVGKNINNIIKFTSRTDKDLFVNLFTFPNQKYSISVCMTNGLIKHLTIYSTTVIKNKKNNQFVIIIKDETEHYQEKRKFKKRLLFEKTVSKLSQILIESGDLDACLKEMGTLARVNRSYIFYLRQNNEVLDNVYEWCNKNTEPEIKKLQNLPSATFPWWMKKLNKFQKIVISDVSKLPPEAINEKRILESQNIKSLLVFPLTVDNNLIGFMGFDDTTRKRDWTDTEIEFLRIMSEMISSFEWRQRSDKKYVDLLRTYQTLAEAANDLIFIIDRNDRVSYVNKYAAKKLGMTVEQILGQKRAELFADDPSQLQYMKKVIETGEPVYEERKLIFSGIDLWLGTSLVPLKDDNNRVFGVLGVARDITQRILVQHKLEENVEQYKSLFNSIQDSIFLIKDDMFIDCNPATLKMFDASRDDIINHSPWEFSPKYQPDGEVSKARAIKKIQAALSGKEQFFEWVHAKKSGITFCAEVFLGRFKLKGDNIIIAQVRDINDRKIQQKALEESEAQYRNLFENSSEGIFILDNDKIVACNPTVEKLFDMPKEKLIGKSPWLLLPSSDFSEDRAKEGALEKIKEVESGVVQNFVWKYQRKDGSEFYLEVKLTTIILNDTLKILGITGDITERIAAEELLKQTEKRFKETVARSIDAYFFLDNEGRIELLNSATEELLGVKFPKDKGKHFLDYIKTTDNKKIRNIFKQVMGGTTVPWLEFSTENKNGNITWIGLNARRVIQDGLVIGIEGFAKDITERKNVEAALKQSEAQYRTLFESFPHEVFAVDECGLYKNANLAFQQQWGKKYFGKKLEKLFKPQSLEQKFLKEYKNLLNCKKLISFSFTYKKNKIRYHYQAILNPILVEGDKLLGVLGLNIDMTELVESLKKTKDYATRLVEIQEEERKRISREIHDSLGGYLSGIQLEISNALNSIDKDNLHVVSRILGESKRTINEAIKSSHELCYDLRPHLLDDFGLTSAVRQYVANFSKRCEIKVLFQNVGDDANLPSTYQVAFFRFVQEALTNVQRHSNASSVKLELNISDEIVKCTVEDDGQGINPDILFERPTKHFGLFNMQERMQLIGGDVFIEDKQKLGAKIIAFVPLSTGAFNGD